MEAVRGGLVKLGLPNHSRSSKFWANFCRYERIGFTVCQTNRLRTVTQGLIIANEKSTSGKAVRF